jgi:hypothetical protein
MNVRNSKACKLLGRKKFIYGMTAMFSNERKPMQPFSILRIEGCPRARGEMAGRGQGANSLFGNLGRVMIITPYSD